MADWTNIADTQLDPDAPLTSELAYAWRDNPVAIADGAAGAPRITHSAFLPPVAGTARQVGPPVVVTGDSAASALSSPRVRPIVIGSVTIRVSVSGLSADSASVEVNGSAVFTVGNGNTQTQAINLGTGDVIRYRFNSNSTAPNRSATFTMFTGNDAPVVPYWSA